MSLGSAFGRVPGNVAFYLLRHRQPGTLYTIPALVLVGAFYQPEDYRKGVGHASQGSK
ncbi:MAG: hypothetical protein NXI32_08410 [bacterium]|nr:hypothetical protein [bacterium]